MKRKVTLLVVLSLVALTAFSQWNWTGGLGTVAADTLPAFGQGIAVDGAGNIWYTSYFSTEFVLVDTGNGIADYPLPHRAIYVFSPDGIEASFSPIWQLTVDGVTDTLWNSNRGLRRDQNGDIIAGSWCVYYRINHLTGEAIDKLLPYPDESTPDDVWDGFSVTTADVDSNGNMVCNAVTASAGPIKAYDASWELIGDLVPADMLNGYSRTIAISPDASAIYHCDFTGSYGLIRFNSSTGNIYGDYTASIDTLFPGLVVEATGWDPAGHLWVGNTGGSGYTNAAYYAFDPNTDALVDSIVFPASVVNLGVKPRGIDFNADGSKAYITFFNTWDSDPIYVVEQGATGVWEHTATFISGYALKANYPNPFNPSTKLDVIMKEAGVADLRVYNLRGVEVAVLNSGELSAGKHSFIFDGTNLAAGVYVVRFTANGAMYTRNVTLAK